MKNMATTPVKTYSVHCAALVRFGKTLAEDVFQASMNVTSPKSGQILRGVRIDYLNSDKIHQFQGLGPISGLDTYAKVLKAFEGASRSEYITKHHDELNVTVELTANDLRCIFFAWNERQNRLEDYAD